MTGRDRRRFQRIRTAWPVILESADGRVGVGQVVDTSLSGMRIATDLDVEPETPLVLRITLPKDLPLETFELNRHRIEPEHPHLSLIFMTVLTQLAAGGFLILWLGHLLSRTVSFLKPLESC